MPPKQANTGARPRGRPPGSAIKPKRAASSTPRADVSRGFSRPSLGSSSVTRKPQQRRETGHESEPDPFADSQDAMDATRDSMPPGSDHNSQSEGENDEPKATIPPELLTRLLHEFFEKDGSRISKDANEAVAKYMDIFVREAIARAAVEKEGGFLEVDDLEKIAPQLLLDL
jgi:centromere protein X